MGYWIAGFILGILCSRSTEGTAFSDVFQCLVLLLGVTALLLNRKLAIIACSFLWGIQHSAPIETPLHNSMVVVDYGFISLPKQPVIAKSRAGERFEVIKIGDRGRHGIVMVGRSSILGRSRILRVRGSSRTGFQQWLAEYMRTAPYAKSVKHWVRAVTSGDLIGSELNSQFRNLGLFHLCVLSGFHVTLLAGVLGFLLELPLRLALAIRIIRPALWLGSQPVLHLTVIGLMAGFSWSVGLGQPMQRAVLLLVLHILAFYRPPTKLAGIVLLAAVLQSFMFPIGFLSAGNLLSWLAYLVVATFMDGGFKGLLKVQLGLFCVVWCVLDIANIGSIFCNILVTPAFPVVFVATLSVLLPGLSFGGEVVAAFLEILAKMELFLSDFRILDLERWKEAGIGRGLALLVTAIIFLNTCAKLSIQKGKN